MAANKKLKANRQLRLRGRKVDFAILGTLEKLLNTSDYRRDHLIEYLHLIQDEIGSINEEYIVALASLLDISQTEVYEVATFYHHFDIVTNSKDVPQNFTIRVCDSVTCEINGANDLSKDLEE